MFTRNSYDDYLRGRQYFVHDLESALVHLSVRGGRFEQDHVIVSDVWYMSSSMLADQIQSTINSIQENKPKEPSPTPIPTLEVVREVEVRPPSRDEEVEAFAAQERSYPNAGMIAPPPRLSTSFLHSKLYKNSAIYFFWSKTI